MSKKKSIDSHVPSSCLNDKAGETKLKAVFETLQMTEEERSAYCRKHGLYLKHLDEWKQQMLGGLKKSPGSKEDQIERRQLTVENKQLKRELNRKEKALAEASALLILKKKADLIWGTAEED